MSLEQRQSALDKANDVRYARAKLKQRIRSGDVSVVEALSDPCMASMTLGALLNLQRKWGPSRTNRLCRRLDVSSARPLRWLSERQQRLIGEALESEHARAEQRQEALRTAKPRGPRDGTGWTNRRVGTRAEQKRAADLALMHPCGAEGCDRLVYRSSKLCVEHCKHEVQARRREIQRLWHEGLTYREIAERLCSSVNAMSAAVAKMRREGWDMPRRATLGRGRWEWEG